MSKPIVILGNPRSGTSMFRSILNSHPSIYIAPECGFAQFLFEGAMVTKNTKVELASKIGTAKKFEYWQISEEEVSSIVDSYYPDYVNIVKHMYLLKAEKENKQNIDFWGDKNNYYVKHLDILPTIFPDAFYIHITRDGRDVATSYKNLSSSNKTEKYQPNLSDNVEQIAEEWTENNLEIASFFEKNSVLEYLHVKYEDLVLDYNSTILQISNYLNVDSNRFMNSDEKLNNDESSTFWWKENLNSKILNTKVGKYRSVLTEDEVDVFNKIAHIALTKYNY